MTADNDDREFTPPPFSFALIGHLATGLVKAAAIALLLWLVGVTGWGEAFSVAEVLVTAGVVMIVVELATTAVERIFVLRHEHPDPGSIPMTLIVAVLPLPSGYLVGLLTGPPSSALVTMVVTGVVYLLALVTLERPWAEGPRVVGVWTARLPGAVQWSLTVSVRGVARAGWSRPATAGAPTARGRGRGRYPVARRP